MDVDSGLDSFLPKIRPLWNFYFFLLFDKLDNGHGNQIPKMGEFTR